MGSAREDKWAASTERCSPPSGNEDRGMELDRPTRPLLTYGTYPVLAFVTAAVLWCAVRWDLDRNAVIGALTAVTIVGVFAVERVNPLRARWSMTKASLLGRDLPFIGLAVLVEQLATAGVSLV